jgi:putative transposase
VAWERRANPALLELFDQRIPQEDLLRGMPIERIAGTLGGRVEALSRPGESDVHQNLMDIILCHSQRGTPEGGKGGQNYDPEFKRPRQFRMQASMSRRGNCFDNAPIESFWGTLKSELLYHRRFATRDEAKRAISEYIEMFYNQQRTQARLDYLSPVAFTQRYYLNQVAA